MASIEGRLTQLLPGLLDKVWCPREDCYPQYASGLEATAEPSEIIGYTQAHGTLTSIIQHLNDSHEWTREQIADWLETLDIDLTFAPEPPPEEIEIPGVQYASGTVIYTGDFADPTVSDAWQSLQSSVIFGGYSTMPKTTVAVQGINAAGPQYTVDSFQALQDALADLEKKAQDYAAKLDAFVVSWKAWLMTTTGMSEEEINKMIDTGVVE